MAIARVSGQNVGTSGNAKSISKAFPSKPAAGNFIGVSAWVYQTTYVLSVADDAAPTANTYNLAQSQTSGGDTSAGGVHYAYNIKTTTNATITVTVTTSNVSDDMIFSMCEYSGVQTSPDPKDVVASNFGNDSAPASGPFTTTATDLILGGLGTKNTAGTITPGTGFSVVDSEYPFYREELEDQLNATAGSYNANWGATAVIHWVAIGASFKAAAGGGGKISMYHDLNGLGGMGQIIADRVG